MAYTTIDKHTAYFNSIAYAGTSSGAKAVTGVGHQPDMIWFKQRDATRSWVMINSVRGVGKALASDGEAAEQTNANYLASFDSDGFTTGSTQDNGTNTNGGTYAAYCWKAGTTSGIDATGADITPTSYSMNATSGISIINYTGNGTDGAKIAHGLGAIPELMIIKRLSNSNYWAVFHKSDVTDYLVFGTTAAFSDAPIWKDTMPTSIYYQTDNSGSVNASGDQMTAWCFKSIPGFSKIGSYLGNGNADGNFVYTGFKPAFIMIKYASGGGTGPWNIYDNKSKGYNAENDYVQANTTSSENSDGNQLDILCNGFKFRSNDGDSNTSGGTYIYYAVGQTLVGSNGIPAVAN